MKGRGEFIKCLHETNRHKAIKAKNLAIAQWLGTEAPREQVLFETVGNEVLQVVATKAVKTFIDFEGTYRLHLLPYFQGRTVIESAERWADYHAHEKRINPKRKLKHDAKHFGRILRHAYEKRLLDRVPKLQLDPYDRSVRRGEVITPEQYRKLYGEANESWKLRLELLVLTGMRYGEVRQLKWEYIDAMTGLIHIPQEITKTREARPIPIDRGLISKLNARKLLSTSPYVFPNRKDPMRPVGETQKSWQRLRERAGLPGLRLHWFRHTNVNLAVRAGYPEAVVLPSRGMSEQVFRRVYRHHDHKTVGAIPRAVRRSLEEE